VVGVFAKVCGGVYKNDANIEFSLLRMKINFRRRAYEQNIRMWLLCEMAVLDRFMICIKLEGVFAK
jgi:hypothetical protein